MPTRFNLMGKTFGSLSVKALSADRASDRSLLWICLCSCGNKTLVSSTKLRSGVTASCGCSRTTHGMHNSREYAVYHAMIQRCHNKNDTNYHLYGKRGIRVCKRWRKGDGSHSGFECFILDMGHCPKGLQLDRKENDEGYCKENCRWTTPIKNSNNKRNNTHIRYRGRLYTIAQLTRKLQLPRSTIRSKFGGQYA